MWLMSWSGLCLSLRCREFSSLRGRNPTFDDKMGRFFAKFHRWSLFSWETVETKLRSFPL